MTLNSTSNNSSIYRYIRPLVFDPKRPNVLLNSELGGICIRFDIDHIESELRISYARCSMITKFCAKLAKKIADRRFFNNEFYSIPFNKKLLLMENLRTYLRASRGSAPTELEQLGRAITATENINQIELDNFSKFADSAHQLSKSSY